MLKVDTIFSPQLHEGRSVNYPIHDNLMKFFLPLLIIAFFACNQKKAEDYINSGNLKQEQMKFREAIVEYDKAINIAPDNAQAYFLRGNAKNNLRDAEGAILDYSKAIELDAAFTDAYYNRGIARFYLGDRDGACEDWVMADALGKANIKDKIKGCKPLTH